MKVIKTIVDYGTPQKPRLLGRLVRFNGRYYIQDLISKPGEEEKFGPCLPCSPALDYVIQFYGEEQTGIEVETRRSPWIMPKSTLVPCPRCDGTGNAGPKIPPLSKNDLCVGCGGLGLILPEEVRDPDPPKENNAPNR